MRSYRISSNGEFYRIFSRADSLAQQVYMNFHLNFSIVVQQGSSVV